VVARPDHRRKDGRGDEDEEEGEELGHASIVAADP
jgi:hypothetical protein